MAVRMALSTTLASTLPVEVKEFFYGASVPRVYLKYRRMEFVEVELPVKLHTLQRAPLHVASTSPQMRGVHVLGVASGGKNITLDMSVSYF